MGLFRSFYFGRYWDLLLGFFKSPQAARLSSRMKPSRSMEDWFMDTAFERLEAEHKRFVSSADFFASTLGMSSRRCGHWPAVKFDFETL